MRLKEKFNLLKLKPKMTYFFFLYYSETNLIYNGFFGQKSFGEHSKIMASSFK